MKAEVFYANYGQRSDFVALAAMGLNMTGKIALVRYGHVYRGNKVSNTAEFGGMLDLQRPIGRWVPEWHTLP